MQADRVFSEFAQAEEIQAVLLECVGNVLCQSHALLFRILRVLLVQLRLLDAHVVEPNAEHAAVVVLEGHLARLCSSGVRSGVQCRRNSNEEL